MNDTNISRATLFGKEQQFLLFKPNLVGEKLHAELVFFQSKFADRYICSVMSGIVRKFVKPNSSFFDFSEALLKFCER